MVLLQPFGLDRVEQYKYLIIFGYGVMAAVTYVLTDLFATYVLKMPRRKRWENKRSIIVAILMCPIMGAFVSCYAGLIFGGSISAGWFSPIGELELSAFVINTGYAAIISFFITVFAYLESRTEELSQRLKDEIELNRILEERTPDVQSADEKADKADEHTITLQGNTKENITLRSADLLYIESEGNYLDAHFIKEGTPVKKTIRCTMKQMETALNSYPEMTRCHRAFIVNTMRISHVDGNAQGYRLHFREIAETVPVSRAYSSIIYDKIEKTKE
jgi:DNA-binding LytR/AlgR family response regulator